MNTKSDSKFITLFIYVTRQKQLFEAFWKWKKKNPTSPEKYFQIFDNSLFLLTVEENRYLVYD